MEKQISKEYIAGIIDGKAVFTEDHGKPVLKIRHRNKKLIKLLNKYFYNEEYENEKEFILRGEVLIKNINEIYRTIKTKESCEKWIKKHDELFFEVFV